MTAEKRGTYASLLTDQEFELRWSKQAGPVSVTEFYSSSEYDDDNVNATIDFKFYNLSQNY